MTYCTKAQIETLKTIGNEWQKGEMHRIYFNDLDEIYGLEVSRYGTGNISSATLQGAPISNSKARKILSALIGKLWYDLTTNEFHSKGIDSDIASELVDLLMEKVDQK